MFLRATFNIDFIAILPVLIPFFPCDPGYMDPILLPRLYKLVHFDHLLFVSKSSFEYTPGLG
jgi:hypothetical protein